MCGFGFQRLEYAPVPLVSLVQVLATPWNSEILHFKTSFMRALILLWSKFPLLFLMDQLDIHEDEYKEATVPLLLTWPTYN